MDDSLPLSPSPVHRLLVRGAPVLVARWLFLRALAIVFVSVFVSLAAPIQGLIGPRGILPASEYLQMVAERFGPVQRLWIAPTFLWLGAGDRALTVLVVVGLAASFLLVFNVLPRVAVAVAGLSFLSFIAVAQEFAMYQSDGMLLEAAFLSFFLAPRGARPGLGAASPPSQAALFLLRWEWFRIYFESGVVKILSRDPQWASLTAMDHYYENGPLPTWIAWYFHQLPHGFHAASCVVMFAVELGVVWLAWLGRRARLIAFAIVTPFQIGIILTANYAFLNYLVLSLGILLLDDGHFTALGLRPPAPRLKRIPAWRIVGGAVALGAVFYVTLLTGFRVPEDLLLAAPARLFAPARIGSAYGLFAVMTESRYELEFQGTTDGTTWVPYRFRYKPQDVREPPGIYAPYQPRFEWNLWFSSLGDWRRNEWVLDAEMRLMQREPAVLALFREDPLRGAPPLRVRVVRWQYWFTTRAERRATGAWWRRREIGLYAPMMGRSADGTIDVAR